MFCNHCGKPVSGASCPACGREMLLRGGLLRGESAREQVEGRLLRFLRWLALGCAVLLLAMGLFVLLNG